MFFPGTFTEWKKKEDEKGSSYIKAIMSIATLNQFILLSIIFSKKIVLQNTV